MAAGKFPLIRAHDTPAMALIESACAVVVAKAFKTFRAQRLRLFEQLCATALPARGRIHEQHVDMAVRHQQEACDVSRLLHDQHALPG